MEDYSDGMRTQGALLLRIDERDGGEWRGALVIPEDGREVAFWGLGELCLRLNDLLADRYDTKRSRLTNREVHQ